MKEWSTCNNLCCSQAMEAMNPGTCLAHGSAGCVHGDCICLAALRQHPKHKVQPLPRHTPRWMACDMLSPLVGPTHWLVRQADTGRAAVSQHPPSAAIIVSAPAPPCAGLLLPAAAASMCPSESKGPADADGLSHTQAETSNLHHTGSIVACRHHLAVYSHSGQLGSL